MRRIRDYGFPSDTVLAVRVQNGQHTIYFEHPLPALAAAVDVIRNFDVVGGCPPELKAAIQAFVEKLGTEVSEHRDFVDMRKQKKEGS